MSFKKYLLLSIIVSIGITTLSVSADDITIDPVIGAFDVDNALGQIRGLKSTIDVLTEQLFALDAQEQSAGTIGERYKEVRDEIVSVISTIQATTTDIEVVMRRIAGYKKNIDTTAQTIKHIRGEIEQTKQTIEEFALFFYQTNNSIADPKKGAIDDLKLLLYSDNIARTLSNQQMLENMLTEFTLLLDKLKQAESQHIASIIKLNELRSQAQQDILVYSEALEDMQQKKIYLSQFISLYQGGSLQAHSLGTVFQNPKNVHDAIVDMVDSVAKKQYAVSFNIFEALKELTTIHSQKTYTHDISWPIYPINSISHFFDDKGFKEEYGFPHRGLQIPAQQGTPVYSVRDGIVYHSTNNDSIGINRLLILHTDGYISTYSYMNTINVQAGDLVKRGQFLGLSGGEPGTRGAGFIAPGSNLSFSIFKNGTPVDPLSILDLSVVSQRNILPISYSIKYLRDKYTRGVDISNLATIDGKTTDERAENFLASYGVGVYKSVSFWDNAVVGTNIDRDMVICVAFAESTLGRYLSTSNNIGNVGNNDRGDRFTFGSALAGARAIAQTLNNQYLGDYHTIDQLSRYGNADGSIYASSPINRQINVLKCLSQIKGYYIPEDFPFRTGINPNLLEGRIISGGFDRQQVRVGSSE